MLERIPQPDDENVARSPAPSDDGSAALHRGAPGLAGRASAVWRIGDAIRRSVNRNPNSWPNSSADRLAEIGSAVTENGFFREANQVGGLFDALGLSGRDRVIVAAVYYFRPDGQPRSTAHNEAVGRALRAVGTTHRIERLYARAVLALLGEELGRRDYSPVTELPDLSESGS